MADADRRPTAAELVALGTDAWSALLAVALPVVRDLPELHADAAVRRLAPLPPSRLVSGRSRRDLAGVLARDAVWDLVEQAMPPDAPRPWQRASEHGPSDDSGAAEREVARLQQQVAHLRGREQDLVDKVGDLRAELDRLRRAHDGAIARAEAAAGAQDAAEAARDEAVQQLAAAQEELAAVEDRVAREVARARRREDGEATALREQLRDARRERDELRRDLAAARERRAATAVPPGGSSQVEAPPPDDSAGRRGRPSRLPDGVVAGTRHAAQWLVAEGRVLLVDGYNVTRTHRSDLPLAEQRRWLEGAVTALAQRRSIDATIVWDSSHGTPTTRRSRGGLTVRFTPQGVTADDELVLHVELAVDPDTPVVAVTDDVELRGRLAQHGVDLLDSQSFTWLL